MTDQDEEYPGKSAYHGRVAFQYDEDRAVESIWAREQQFVHDWTKTLEAKKYILDVPTGTGRFLETFHQHGLNVTALDISSDMVAEIRRRYPVTSHEIKIGVGDAERLDISDNEMDYVISWRFFHLIPGTVVDRVLHEFHRVCRGVVVIQVFGVQASGWRGWLAAACRRIATLASHRQSPRAPLATPSPWAHIKSYCHREDELRKRFGKAGFLVKKAVTLEVLNGRYNRVYFLQKVGSTAKPA